ncbi:MAG: hypothetical protein HY811_07475 [Planctomycetes bacterium]|nr:hypothetical protein [Planctomycetota bacterium]
MLRMNVIFKATCIVIILFGLNCQFNPPSDTENEKAAVPKIATDPKLIPPPPRTPLEIVRDSPADVIHRDVIQKISEGKYLTALEEINMMANAHTSSEAYVIEAQILRLILLTSLRISYLHLANGYQKGWETVLKMPDEYLAVKERTDRLTNLSRISGNYYELHKKISVQLIKAYDTFSEIQPDFIKGRLRIIALGFKYSKIIPNTTLEKIKEGVLPATATREEAEKAEIHNCILLFWTALTGLYSWLAGSFRWQTEECPDEAFGDKPDLRKILLNRAKDFLIVTEQLTAKEPSPAPNEKKPLFLPEQYYPETLFPKPAPKK